MSHDVLHQVAARSDDKEEFLRLLDILGLDLEGELSEQRTPNGMSPTKIPQSEIPKILSRYMAGESYREIGADYGVSAGAIHHHVRARLTPEQIRDGRRATGDACGTPKGYRRHKSAGERPCRKCLDAWNKYCAEHQTKRPA